MQETTTLLSIIQMRGKRELLLTNVYRMLYNKNLYLTAYGKLYRNKGAMTRGTTPETVDGMSLAKIDRIIALLRQERYRWTPVRRVHIPKAAGKTRPLGIPSWSDKLLQEVMRLILNAFYEPQFDQRSHGFRPGRGCHTALSEVQRIWTGTRWFVEGDIVQYYDSIDHSILLTHLRKRIHDNRFLELVRRLLEAGYLEDWQFHKTLSGAPQGGIVSPILANIYLHEFDRFVTRTLIPQYTRGEQRRTNPAKLNRKTSYLWRAVDQHGNVLDILVESRQNKAAAKKFFCKLLKGCEYVPRVLITDKLGSYEAAKNEVMPSVEHRKHKRLNNRADNSHQPTRQRERTMRCFKSPGHAQRFLSTFGPIREHFCPRRHRLRAEDYRRERVLRFQVWNEVSSLQMAA